MPREKLSLPNIKTASCLFLEVPKSPLSAFLQAAKLLIEQEPDIVTSIEEDLNRLAREKKLARIKDRQYLHEQQGILSGQETATREIKARDLGLERGRPRTSPKACFYFLMLRAYCGGGKSVEAKNLFYDSLAVHALFLEEHIKKPSLSTLIDNTNAISHETRSMLLDAQLKLILKENLDDFKMLTVDSTHVSANSCWPTDSKIILNLARRLWKRGKKLAHFGLNAIEPEELPDRLREMKKQSFKIVNLTSNAKREDKRKVLYCEFLDEAELISQTYDLALNELDASLKKVELKPSRREQLERLILWMRDDLENLYKAIEYCTARIMEGRSTPSRNKVLSIADPEAAYIEKGNREAVIGYRVQVVRSLKGFITTVLTPKGNASDSQMLVPAFKDSIKRTGVIPEVGSADDGYAGQAAYDALRKIGIKKLSISGAKGKRQTSEEDWESETYREARRMRSAVESVIYQLKRLVHFGGVMRRGLEAVTAELLDKVVAFNFMRLAKFLPT